MMKNSGPAGHVLVVGDVNVDLVVRLPQPDAAGALHMVPPQMMGGGSAANTAHALRRLGVPVAFMGTVGQDAYGRFSLEEFAAAGIDTRCLVADPALNTVCVFAFVQPDGERFLWPWPQQAQSFRELDESRIDWDMVDHAAWVHASGMVFSSNTSARHTVTAVLRRAAQRGVPTSFDLNIRAENGGLAPDSLAAIEEAMAHCRYVLGGAAEEFVPLAGGPVPGQAPLDAAAGFATARRAVVARLGGEGSVAITPAQRTVVPAVPVPVVDTIGAGDVYNAGFIKACLDGCPLVEAALWGNATAAYAVGRPGPRNTPDAATVEAMLATAPPAAPPG